MIYLCKCSFLFFVVFLTFMWKACLLELRWWQLLEVSFPIHCWGGVLYKIDIFRRNSAFTKARPTNTRRHVLYTYIYTTKWNNKKPKSNSNVDEWKKLTILVIIGSICGSIKPSTSFNSIHKKLGIQERILHEMLLIVTILRLCFFENRKLYSIVS